MSLTLSNSNQFLTLLVQQAVVWTYKISLSVSGLATIYDNTEIIVTANTNTFKKSTLIVLAPTKHYKTHDFLAI